VIPTPVHNGRRLDWVPRFDEASRGFAAAPGVATLPERGRLWNPGRVLDQGQEGACTGFAAAAEAAAEPVPVPRVTNRYARGWYHGAQRRDEWPGEAYDGSSVLGTMKEGKARGLYGRYVWSFRVEQLAHGIVRDETDDGGPAVIGVPWHAGSYSTDALGVLRPSGDVVGGHALCLPGFVPRLDFDAELWDQLEELDLAAGVHAVFDTGEDGAFVGINSWGPTFGRGGLFVVSVSVVRGWFAARGEFAHPEQRRLPAQRKGTAMTELEQSDEEQPVPEMRPGDETLHILAVDVRDGDRLLDPPEDVGQESVTVRGAPQVVNDWRGRRVVINSTAGVFQLGAGDPVTVRREQ
jgi:hypothetical protein